MMRTRLEHAFVGTLFVASALLPATTLPDELRIVKGPYLQNTQKDSITIMWETSVESDSLVQFGLTERLEESKQSDREVKIHEVTLTQVKSDTTYFYRVASAEVRSDISTFRTAPDAVRPFRFAVCGDNRGNPKTYRKLLRSILDERVDFVITLGDYVHSGKNYEEWGRYFFEPGEELMKRVAVWPCIGNHESVPPQGGEEGAGSWYRKFFSVPPNGSEKFEEYWYSFDNSNAHFVQLGYSRVTKQRLKWLEQDLGRCAADWKIVYLHYPLFGAAGFHDCQRHALELREALHPLLEKHGVDVVLLADEHNYQRLHPIGTVDGEHAVTYINSSGAGAGLRPVVGQTKYLHEGVLVKGEAVHHFCVFDIASQRLSFRAISVGGEVIDAMEINKGDENAYAGYMMNKKSYGQIQFPWMVQEHSEGPVLGTISERPIRKVASVVLNTVFPSHASVRSTWVNDNPSWRIEPREKEVMVNDARKIEIPFSFEVDPATIYPIPYPMIRIKTDVGETRALRGPLPQYDLKRQTVVSKGDSGPTFDGRLGEAFWNDAGAVDCFGQVDMYKDGDQGVLADPQPFACLKHDGETLYVGVKCPEKDMKTAEAEWARRGSLGVFGPMFRVSFKTGKTRGDVFWLMVSGAEPEKFKMMPQHAGVRAKTWRGADCWEAEIAIPLEVLGLELRAADKQTILADFIKVNGFKRFATWSSSWNLFRPEYALRHGILVLE